MSFMQLNQGIPTKTTVAYSTWKVNDGAEGIREPYTPAMREFANTYVYPKLQGGLYRLVKDPSCCGGAPVLWLANWLYDSSACPDPLLMMMEKLRADRAALAALDKSNKALADEVAALQAELDRLNALNADNAAKLAARKKEMEENIEKARVRCQKIIDNAEERARREIAECKKKAAQAEADAVMWTSLVEKRKAQLEQLLALEAKLKAELEEKLRLDKPGMVCVEVLEARDLVGVDVSKTGKNIGNADSDAYTCVHFGDVDHKAQTKAIKSKKPKWLDAYWYPVTDKSVDEVDFYLKDKDISKDDLIGRVSVNIWDVYDGKVIEEWARIRGAETGELRFRISFSTGTKSPNGKLNINIVECTNLLAADSGGTSDPFVVPMWLGEKQKVKHKTRVMTKTLNPHFDEDFTFHIEGRNMNEDSMVNKIRFEVKDQDKFSGSDDLGGCVFDTRHLDDNVEKEVILELQDDTDFMVKHDGDNQGKLKVIMTWKAK